MTITKLLIIYLVAINIFASIISIIDKHNAKHGKRRISEDFLMTTGLLGGALLEFITMKTIHHKTKHKKFMIGLPIEFTIHIMIIILVFLYA